MQLDPLSPQETRQPELAPVQEAKVQKRNLTAMILMVFLVITLIAAAGLGFWAIQLNSKLAATQQQLTTLQGAQTQLQSDYAKLKSDNDNLTTELNQSKADLEKTNGDLTTAQADLKKSQDQNKGLQDKINSASKKVKILNALFTAKATNDFLAIDTLIKATNDKQLLTDWNNFSSSPTAENVINLWLSITHSILNDLK